MFHVLCGVVLRSFLIQIFLMIIKINSCRFQHRWPWALAWQYSRGWGLHVDRIPNRRYITPADLVSAWVTHDYVVHISRALFSLVIVWLSLIECAKFYVANLMSPNSASFFASDSVAICTACLTTLFANLLFAFSKCTRFHTKFMFSSIRCELFIIFGLHENNFRIVLKLFKDETWRSGVEMIIPVSVL